MNLKSGCAGMSEAHDAQQAVALEEQAHAHAQAQLQAAAQAQNLAAKAQAHAHAQVSVLCKGGMSLAAARNAGLLDAQATGEAMFLCLSTVLCAVSADAVTLCFDRDLIGKLTVCRLMPKLKLSRWPTRLTTCKPMPSNLM